MEFLERERFIKSDGLLIPALKGVYIGNKIGLGEANLVRGGLGKPPHRNPSRGHASGAVWATLGRNRLGFRSFWPKPALVLVGAGSLVPCTGSNRSGSRLLLFPCPISKIGPVFQKPI